MFEMEGWGRIERVARISPVDNDVTNSFRRNRREERKQESEFQQMLTQKVAKKERAEASEVTISDPYTNDVNRMTHSLFYNKMVKLNINFTPRSALLAYE